jgi:periodic tryptophan protein 2
MAATTEGLLVYSLDEETMFDPTDLGEDVTPAAAASALQQGAHARALLLALRLKDLELVRRTLEAVPPAEIRTNAQTVPHVYLPRVLVRSRWHVIASPL